ncbi:Mediator of RNA polymerase II transcription subunit 27 [Merluccius polli]|uniref:Mediator of RNA polymerase II transcription subunit 27 n=1 Tax=Merluccius polli TaxID=89951 RepID=A0AA47P5K3_MERPO|nr:Mediator of RNA polymerase II transcription subunit 27 [Merluccius polli]
MAPSLLEVVARLSVARDVPSGVEAMGKLEVPLTEGHTKLVVPPSAGRSSRRRRLVKVKNSLSPFMVAILVYSASMLISFGPAKTAKRARTSNTTFLSSCRSDTPVNYDHSLLHGPASEPRNERQTSYWAGTSATRPTITTRGRSVAMVAVHTQGIGHSWWTGSGCPNHRKDGLFSLSPPLPPWGDFAILPAVNMADVMNVGVNLEAFSQAINAIQALRSSVTRVFDSLKDGMKNKETLEGREKAFITEFQDNLQSVNRDLNELERLSGLVGRPSESHPLHNSGLLSLDPVQDKTPLYSQLLQAYKWSNKYHAGLASNLLNQQSLKRSANQMGASAKRRPKVQPSTLVPPPQYVDDVITRIGRMFPDMSIELFRPNGTSAVLLVSLGKVLKAIVVMRSLFIDRTIVRGFNENIYSEDGKLDIWSKSQYQVFQKVTDHATTALLHYQLPQMPDVVVRSFMTWLRSYIKLFQSPCQRCGRFLQDGLPPTWRDFRTLEAFHDTCRM